MAPANWTGFTAFLRVETAYDMMSRKTREVVSTDGVVQRVTQSSYDLAGRPDCVAVRMNPAVFPDEARCGRPGEPLDA